MRDIDKEKKDQRKAEALALREVRKQQVLQTVLRAGSLKEAAQTLDTNGEELKARLEKYGVIHNFGEIWSHAVKDYLDAGQPHQYEMPVSTFEEFIDKPSELETKLQDTLKEAILEGRDEAELILPDPARPDRTIKYNLPL